MAVTNHHIHAIERRNLLRRTLPITAGEHYPRVRIRSPHLPQKGPGVTIRIGSHAASVQNHYSRYTEIIGFPQSSLAQARGNRLTIRPARPAPKVLNVIFFHVNQSTNGIDARQRAQG